MVGIISYEKFCTIFRALSYKCPATWAISATDADRGLGWNKYVCAT